MLSAMDITLIKSFLEVAASGSFISASERLFVTQSAVSLRIQRLEDSLGRPLFTRSKAGVELTPAGREFEKYALNLINIWEEARQQIAIPQDFKRTLTIGAQSSLWPRLGFRWLDRLRETAPDIKLRAEMGMPDRLTRSLSEGIIQVALMYTPQLRPGLSVEKVVDEELILVAPWPNPTMDLHGRYLFVDWGPEFLHAHATHLPELSNPGLTLAIGTLAADFIISRNYAAYLPARHVKRYLDSHELHLIPGAPLFPFPIWSAWRNDLDAEVAKISLSALRHVTQNTDTERESVMQRWLKVSAKQELVFLGQSTRSTSE